MDSSGDISQLKKQYECAICLQQLYKPKTLNCHHSFCKDCLDEIVTFQHDGSASISCPMRCDVTTKIACNETTNALAANYHVKGTLDIMCNTVKNKSLAPVCQAHPQCVYSVSKWCLTCHEYFCKFCLTQHFKEHDEVQGAVDVEYNSKQERLEPLCDEHQTVAKFVCHECKMKFVCLYCKQRNHKTHVLEKIEECSQKIRTWIDEQKEKFKQKCIELGSKEYASACKQMEFFKSDFIKEIKNRKVKRVSKYMSWLCDEEKKLRETFRNMVETFKREVGNDDEWRLEKYIGGVNEKADFELIAEKSAVQQEIVKICKNTREKSLSRFYVNFKELTDDVNTDAPLGELSVDHNKDQVCVDVENPLFWCLLKATNMSGVAESFIADIEEQLAHSKELLETTKPTTSHCENSTQQVAKETVKICTDDFSSQFPENSVAQEEKEGDETIETRGRMFHPKKIDDIKAGMQASIKREGKHPLGVIKWIGKFPHSSTVQIGIELDEKFGKHDGSYQGKQYFKCKPGHGVFVSFHQILIVLG